MYALLVERPSHVVTLLDTEQTIPLQAQSPLQSRPCWSSRETESTSVPTAHTSTRDLVLRSPSRPYRSWISPGTLPLGNRVTLASFPHDDDDDDNFDDDDFDEIVKFVV